MSAAPVALTGETFEVAQVTAGEPFEPTTSTPVGVVAGHISAVSTKAARSGGDTDRVALTGTFTGGPVTVPLAAGSTLTDTSGRAWRVVSARPVQGLGLDHWTARVESVEGQA